MNKVRKIKCNKFLNTCLSKKAREQTQIKARNLSLSIKLVCQNFLFFHSAILKIYLLKHKSHGYQGLFYCIIYLNSRVLFLNSENKWICTSSQIHLIFYVHLWHAILCRNHVAHGKQQQIHLVFYVYLWYGILCRNHVAWHSMIQIMILRFINTPYTTRVSRGNGKSWKSQGKFGRKKLQAMFQKTFNVLNLLYFFFFASLIGLN